MEKYSTGKLNVERPFFLWIVKFVLGSVACNMHVSDCHWFRLRESPTNIIFFPLNLLTKSWPLNLHQITYAIDHSQSTLTLSLDGMNLERMRMWCWILMILLYHWEWAKIGKVLIAGYYWHKLELHFQITLVIIIRICVVVYSGNHNYRLFILT